MPYRDPLRILILPPGISIPPPVGEGAIRLDPGPPPSIDFYTGSADEANPGSIQTFTASVPDSLLGVVYTSPDAVGVNSSALTLSENVSQGFSIAELEADRVILGAQNGAGSIELRDGTFSDETSMQYKSNSDQADQNVTLTAIQFNTVGFTFIAPKSGGGIIGIGAELDSATGFNIRCWAEIRDGGSIGSGTLRYNGNQGARRVLHESAAVGHSMEAGNSFPIDFVLTPGNTYNASLWVGVSGGTGIMKNGMIWWMPSIGSEG